MIVDSEEVERLKKYKWHLIEGEETFYAVRNVHKNGKRTLKLMHRIILGITDPKVDIDHHNHSGLDNRKQNIRACSRSQNQWNQKKKKGKTSKYYVVNLDKATGKYIATINVDKKSIYLGIFKSEKKAALAARKASIKYQGKFSHYYNSSV